MIKVRRRLVGDLQPAVNEGMLLVDRRVGRQQRMDAAAIDVAEHDDVLYRERGHAVLQRCADAMLGAVDQVRRHQVGDVAHHEQIARLGVGQDCGIDPRIRAGDHHHLRLLLAGQLLEARSLRQERAAAELQESSGQLAQRHGGA
jgi:hypothetical protein